MRVTLRMLLVFPALLIAYLVTRLAVGFTGVPLGDGIEGTPSTVVAIFAAFPLTLILVLVIGNLLISRYFQLRSSK